MKIPKKETHPFVGDNLTRFYHIPVISYFFLHRLQMALDLMGKKTFESILEIGFGSGVLLPELSLRTKRLYGVDLHDSIDIVEEMLNNENIAASVTKGDVLHLPYQDESFECVVSIATLEHIKEIDTALCEIKRVLKKGGIAVLGFPVANKFSDVLLVLTGSLRAYRKRLREIHPNSHGAILVKAQRQFGNLEVQKFPFFLPMDWALYCCCLGVKDVD